MSQLYTLPQVAGMLQVSVATLRTWQAKGKLNVVRLPTGTVRVHEDELNRIMQPVEAARLSKLLFLARESVEMWADVVEARAGKPDAYTRELVAAIDEYRAEQGWNPDGFGVEGGQDGE